VERGLERGAPVERTRLIGSIARALVAETEWDRVREVVKHPELSLLVSNVTEAGFRLDQGELGPAASGTAPESFPGRLSWLLYARFITLPEGPPLLVIPTELVDDNGPRLAAMVRQVGARRERAGEFLHWMGAKVRFRSSLVDRITVAAAPAVHAELEARLGYQDQLLTLTGPGEWTRTFSADWSRGT
jgi:tagaturonate reductase